MRVSNENWCRNCFPTQDRVIEAGTAIGVVAMTIASIVGAPNLVTFEANPDIAIDAQENFRRNGFEGIKSQVGILKNRHNFVKGEEVDFHVAKSFWASRLHRVDHRKDIAKTIKVPTFCLEDEITRHSASAFVCDIEGGEVDLLIDAELAGIKTIIIETHPWAAGKEPTDEMSEKPNLSEGIFRSVLKTFSAHQIFGISTLKIAVPSSRKARVLAGLPQLPDSRRFRSFVADHGHPSQCRSTAGGVGNMLIGVAAWAPFLHNGCLTLWKLLA